MSTHGGSIPHVFIDNGIIRMNQSVRLSHIVALSSLNSTCQTFRWVRDGDVCRLVLPPARDTDLVRICLKKHIGKGSKYYSYSRRDLFSSWCMQYGVLWTITFLCHCPLSRAKI